MEKPKDIIIQIKKQTRLTRGEHYMKKYSKRYLFIIFLTLIFIANALASNTWNLGRYSFVIDTTSTPLRATMGGVRGLTSYSFLSSVGGISFEAIAAPNLEIKSKAISLSYDPAAPDSQRLSISIGESTYQPFIPDWQLIPIANYADSKYNACVSLIGPNTTKETYHIVYHPAFENTLLGLRLLQADIILINPYEFWQLPKFEGNTILGLGETIPDANQWIIPTMTINIAMQSDSYNSWILTDFAEEVQFGINTKEFGITGYPYYYFWKADVKKYKRILDEYAKKAEEYQKKNQFLEYFEIVWRINSLKPEVLEVGELTNRLKDKRAVIQKINPTVYNSANQTMRFAAFFRYVNNTDNVLWKNFFKQLKDVQIEPSIKTPTKWKKP